MNGVHDEERLLADLRRIAAEVDPVPDLVFDNARAVFGMRRIDEELIELVRDSANERHALATVRGDTDVRMLSFEFADVTVELQVTRSGDTCELVAQLYGADVAAARVEDETGTRDVTVDVDTLVVDQVPHGLVRLHLSTAQGSNYVTSWVRI